MAVLLDRAMPFTSVASRGGAQRRNATVTLAVDPLPTSTIRLKWAAHVLRSFRLNTKSGGTNLSMAASSGFTTQSSVVCSRAVATVHCKNRRQQLLRIDRRLLTDSVEFGNQIVPHLGMVWSAGALLRERARDSDAWLTRDLNAIGIIQWEMLLASLLGIFESTELEHTAWVVFGCNGPPTGTVS